MNSIFIVTYLIWLLSEVLLNRLLRSKTTDKQNVDKGSLTIIWVTICFSFSAAVLISSLFVTPISSNMSLPYIGLTLIIVGLVIRLAIVVTLGRFFTVDVTIKQNHKLKTNGFYKYVRHPSYSASLLSFIGFGISLNNWVSLAIVLGAIVSAFLMRIHVEEKALLQQFGSEYLSYKRLTKRIIPFIY